MLYSTSSKIVAGFLNNLVSRYFTTSSYSTIVSPEKKFCFSSHLAETDDIVI